MTGSKRRWRLGQPGAYRAVWMLPRRPNLATATGMTGQSALQNASAVDRDNASRPRVPDEARSGVTVADVTLGPERHLTFRLTEPVPLPE